jgi:sugar/nucleoside kinase (ribokinase family)
MDAPVTLAGNSVGTDETGREITRDLAGRNIQSLVAPGSFKKTPGYQALIERDTGRRSFILSYENIQQYDPHVLDRVIEETRDGLYSHVFAQVYLRELCARYLAAVADVTGLWILTQDLEANSDFVPRVDAIQNSLPDEIPMTDASLQAIAAPFFARGGRLKTMIFTAGSRGAAWCERGQTAIRVPAVPCEKVVDTTGCGDAFRAGLMKGLFEGLSKEKALELGQKAGARKAQLYGAHF